MSTKVCRLTIVLLALYAAQLSGTAARADWFYDFNDGKIPNTLITQSRNTGGGTPTFSSSAQGGKLRFWDYAGNTPSAGGTWEAWSYNAEWFSGDVRVSAEINATGNSNDEFAVAGRFDSLGHGYEVSFSFRPGDEDLGRLYISKMLPDRWGQLFYAPGRLTQLNRSYFLEMDIKDNPQLGWPTITGRLFDHEGGTVLLEQTVVDSNLEGLPPNRAGTAGVWAYTWDNNVFDASFDNIRAMTIVPEPSSAVLLVMGAGGLVACRWRRKRLP